MLMQASASVSLPFCVSEDSLQFFASRRILKRRVRQLELHSIWVGEINGIIAGTAAAFRRRVQNGRLHLLQQPMQPINLLSVPRTKREVAKTRGLRVICFASCRCWYTRQNEIADAASASIQNRSPGSVMLAVAKELHDRIIERLRAVEVRYAQFEMVDNSESHRIFLSQFEPSPRALR